MKATIIPCGRICLRWFVGVSFVVPLAACVVVLLLFINGMIGRCDGIFRLGITYLLSLFFFVASLIGNLRMLTKRRGEPAWLLIALLVLQVLLVAYLAFWLIPE